MRIEITVDEKTADHLRVAAKLLDYPVSMIAEKTLRTYAGRMEDLAKGVSRTNENIKKRSF